MNVKEYAQYLLDNFPHDAELMEYIGENGDNGEFVYSTPPRVVLKNSKSYTGAVGFPEGVEQIVVI